jgi:hypothetical protein
MARVEGIEPQQTSFLMRQIFKKVRKILGRDITPQKIIARVPRVFWTDAIGEWLLGQKATVPHFSEEQLTELAASAARENSRARFNHVFNLAGMAFIEKDCSLNSAEPRSVLKVRRYAKQPDSSRGKDRVMGENHAKTELHRFGWRHGCRLCSQGIGESRPEARRTGDHFGR